MLLEPQFRYPHGQKKNMAANVVETVELDWPWPTRADCSSSSSTSPPNDKEAHPTDSFLPSGGRVYRLNEAGESTSRILSMSVDPIFYQRTRLEKENRLGIKPRFRFHAVQYQSWTRTRPVALLFSSGDSVRLPLLPLSSGPYRWKFSSERSTSGAETDGLSTASLSEVVVGELSTLCVFSRLLKAQRQPSREASPARSDECLSPSGRRGKSCKKGKGASEEGQTISEPPFIHTIEQENRIFSCHEVKYFGMQQSWPLAAERERVCSMPNHPTPVVYTWPSPTLPYKLLWLQSGHVLLSLPCEERLVTLAYPNFSPLPGEAASAFTYSERVESPTHPALAVEVRRSRVVGSFALPAGVVPLDVVELAFRNMLAVGTVEHGALLCHLDPHTGMVTSIARRLSSFGVGSPLFPVTRLAVVAPALRSTEGVPFYSPTNDLSTWEYALEVNRRIKKNLVGATKGISVVLFSPYEIQCVVIRCGPMGVGGDGVWEDPPLVLKNGAHDLLYAPPQSETDGKIGLLLCTSSRGLVRLGYSSTGKLTEKAVGRAAVKTEEIEEGNGERSSSAKEYGSDRSGGDEPTGLQEGEAKAGAFFQLEAKRVYLPLDVPLTRLCDGAPVYQRADSNYTPRFRKHWLLVMDARNFVYLLDNRCNAYLLHRYLELPSPPFASPEGEGSPSTAKLEEEENREKPGQKRKRGKAKPVSIKTSRGFPCSLPPPKPPSQWPHASDCATGLVVFYGQDKGFFAAAAHHRRFLSIMRFMVD